MPVPFETLLPYAIMVAMFGATGAGMTAFKKWQNEGLMPRYSLDQWDRQSEMRRTIRSKELHTNVYMTVMDRDRRLTGTFRGQTDNPVAPAGFEFSNGWKLEKRFT